MKKYNATDYIFASGYIQSREKYLLTREKIDKMLDAGTPDDALKILYELNYGDASEEVSALEFETLLSRELEKTYNLILPLVPEREYFAIFLFPNDYHNVKTLLKAEFSGIGADKYLINAGSIPLPRLMDLVRNRNYPQMRTEMAHGIREVIDTYGVTQDPQTIDLILDKACYRDINIETAELENDFVRGYIALKIDAVNLKSFIRVKEMNKPRDFFSRVYMEGGNIPERLFAGGYDETPEQFAEKLDIYGMQALLLKGFAMIRETGRFTALEKLCDDLLMDYVKDAKYASFGIEPLIAYMAARENDIKTVRIIMSGKLANIPAELIRERIRKTYV